METSKYEPHFHGPVQGIVIGDNNTVTLVFQGGQQLTVPFLAPPRPPYNLVGRDDLLRHLKQRLFAGGSGNLALSAFNGLPGVGKTALAVELANDPEVLGHFQDGVLWARLGRDADVLAVLSAWGAALGIPQAEMAKLTSIEAWADAIHTTIGMRHMLLVADDAWKPETALAFKLGGPHCAHVVTTRLPEVAIHFAGEGTTLVRELSETDGLRLLEQMAPEAVAAEPNEAQELVRAIGGLPLALTLLGKYLRIETYIGQPHRLHAALEKLRQAEERLQLAQPQTPLERHPSLPAGARVSLEAVIGISDEALDEATRGVIQTLSVFPAKPNSFSREAALAVSAATPETLDKLADYGLLESSGTGRYMLHQTITDYMRLRLTVETAYERMAEFFVHYTETHQRDFSALDLETRNMLTALQIAFERGMQAELVRGVKAIYDFLETRGLYELAEVHLKRAQQAAKSLGDAVGSARALSNLGTIARNRGDYLQAEEYLYEGLTLAREIGHSAGISALLTNLGEVAFNRGDYTQAEEYFLEGLTVAREIGHHGNISNLLLDLGAVLSNRGDYTRAEEYFLESLTLAREMGNRELIIGPLMNLGVVAGIRGNYVQGEEYLLEGLTLAREIGYREKISFLLTNLGAIVERLGDYTRAEGYYLEGLEVAHEIGHREHISTLLTSLGALSGLRGDHARAEEYFREGLALAREIGNRENISYLLANLGEVLSNRRDYVRADDYFREGLALAREIGHRWLISGILNEWGELHLRQRELDLAYKTFLEALEIAREVGAQEHAATALYGLAQVAVAKGNIAEARLQGQEGLTIFEAIGHNKATEVRQWLAELPAAPLR